MGLHSKIIQRSFVNLVESIQFIDKVWDQLIQMGVISLSDVINKKQKHHDERNQVRDLLSFILTRPKTDYKCLRKALKKTNQSHVVDEFLPASILQIRVSLTTDPAVEEDRGSLYSEIEKVVKRNKEDFINVLLLPMQVSSDATHLIFILKCFTKEHMEPLEKLYRSFLSGSLREALQTLINNKSNMQMRGISKLCAEVEIENEEYIEAQQYLSICEDISMMQRSVHQLVVTTKEDTPKGIHIPVKGLMKSFGADQYQKALRQQNSNNTRNEDERFEEDDLLNIALKALSCAVEAQQGQQDYTGSIFVVLSPQIASTHGGTGCSSCPAPCTRRRAAVCKDGETEYGQNKRQRTEVQQKEKKGTANTKVANSESEHQKKIETDTKDTTAVREQNIDVTSEMDPMIGSKPNADAEKNEDQQGPQEIRAEEDIRFSRYQTSCDLVICSTAQRTDDESVNDWPVIDRSSIERLASETPCQDVEKIFMHSVNISKCHVEVFNMLSKCDGTSDLFLTDVTDGTDNSYNICNGLKKCMKKYKKLRNFGIWYIHLKCSGKRFIEHIDTSNLVTFTLQETLLSKPGETLSKMLSKCTILTWLNLLETKLEDHEWTDICKAITTHCPGLVGLVLDYNDLSQVTDEVLETLKAVQRLRVLGISYCCLNDAWLVKISQNLPSELEVLDMRDSKTNVGDWEFEDAILKHESIRFLRLEETQIPEGSLNKINQNLDPSGGKVIIKGKTPEESYTFLYNYIYATACKYTK